MLQIPNVSSTAQGQGQLSNKLKELLTSVPVFVHYNPKHPTIIAADASNAGIRALLQQT